MSDPKNDDPLNFSRRVPEGDNRQRLVCDDCGFIQYENPRIVVGVVASWEGQILLCRRAIAPRKGYWTLPAGYLELGETTEQGAVREAWEEARAELAIDQLLAVYSIARISQVQMIYRAWLRSPRVQPGPESLEVALFPPDRIPVDDIAFPSVHWALKDYQETLAQAVISPRTAPFQQG
ncbi:NUDIX hydrolase [Thioalkalivibrio paradoxus]|uniref:NUDIX hydrolase n=1 Tax=Thioalkalivibrio paradoxus ARh 1 TaxID=713585 RepID=W0DI03_9GAMM|nr:NUDIX hydrolase [Thioalkalivibrio paradoxus]AHE98041.1 NUDIX hydrolase [Thioalkalivibrio paradoxus ARh 1]